MTSPDRAVDLTSLEIIRRYSLAVRQDSASRSEVVAALRADLAWLEGGSRTATRSRTAVPERIAPVADAVVPDDVPPAPVERAPAAKAPARKAPSKVAAKAPAKKAPAKKAAPRR